MEFNATFIVAFISFIVFTVIMNLILYKPINKIVSKRKEFIDENYKQAKLKTEKTELIYKDKKKQTDKAKQDAKKLIAQKIDEAKNKKTELTSSAQTKANETINSAKEALNQSNESAKNVLSGQIVNLAKDISSKILGEHIEVKTTDSNIAEELMREG